MGSDIAGNQHMSMNDMDVFQNMGTPQIILY